MKVSVSLLNLRKMAIQKEAEVTFRESASGRAWKVSGDGIVKFAAPKPWGTPVDHNPESVLQAADEFLLTSHGQSRRLTRSEMEAFLARIFQRTTTSQQEAED